MTKRVHYSLYLRVGEKFSDDSKPFCGTPRTDKGWPKTTSVPESVTCRNCLRHWAVVPATGPNPTPRTQDPERTV